MNKSKSRHSSALSRARRAISKRLYELQFKTYPKELRDKLTELELDPEHRYSDERIECAAFVKERKKVKA